MQSSSVWVVVREGTVSEVDYVVSVLKKNGGNINARNQFGLTPLHIATWRNHLPILKRLLDAGADPNARDGESGWSSLHRALHFGHLAVASVLILAGASITLEDCKSRSPIDLISGPVLQAIGAGDDAVATEVFSWGSGVNYQLGTGNAHIQKLPCKLDSLNGSVIKLVSAAKFHSVAVSALGEVYTWGFGRGGRLGHPDFDIHSGQAAVITPRHVTSGLGARKVKAIAAAKHHTVIATEGGEVFTWGSNREGQLGYTSVDTQPTPRRVSTLKSKIVAVAAANKHTAVVSGFGEVFTWGCNKEGQLGYGTSKSASNYTPRVVEYLNGKVFVDVAAAKNHTIVLGADGEVFTWGHRLVTPKRVIIARNLKKAGNTVLKFHRKNRIHVVSIAAGMAHSMALTDDGALFCWDSSDPDLRCVQLYALCRRNVVHISAGKYWTAAVTVTGDVYMWDGKNTKGAPVPTRLHGLKKATSVAVGETHLLCVTSLYHPVYDVNGLCPAKPKLGNKEGLMELHEGFSYDDLDSGEFLSTIESEEITRKTAPSLKSLCEKVAANHLAEPRNAITLLEMADSLGADDLRKHCEEIAIRNLDFIFAVAVNGISSTSLEILADLEKSLDLKSSEPWSYRRLPTPTATYPAIINSEEEDSNNEFPKFRDNCMKTLESQKVGRNSLDSFFEAYDVSKENTSKQIRTLRKKLQQIEMLESKQFKGQALDEQQIAKLKTRPILESSLLQLGVPVETISEGESSSVPFDGKSSMKVEVSRQQQRRKNKKKGPQMEELFLVSKVLESSPAKSSLVVDVLQDIHKDVLVLVNDASNKINTFSGQKIGLDSPKSKSSSNAASKRKNRKGGLSMFLKGGLDDVPNVVSPPPMLKNDGPAWGGSKIPKDPASLREILDEQSKAHTVKSPRPKNHLGEHPDGDVDGKVLLSSFIPSNPIPVVSTRTADGEKNTPPWAASGTPPHASRPSLRDIQVQQGKQYQGLSHSPNTRTTGFSVTTGQGSPSESGTSSRWYKPEMELPSSLRSIQIEERAIKDLKRFYSSVKIVKNQS
ncbi:guanyl-nucleotide exchange factor [Lithospermum erythrorhizon]|uniref:Guanyl-nucleotide exchange factor n=1 Tax=Lithospermum erythrorhizon TaxID=34254 RepID=A0AAV3RBI3_LITER